MDGGGKKIESICKCVPSIMALTYIEIEQYHKSGKNIMKQKYGMNPYMDDASETILPIYKGLISIMRVTDIGAEKWHKSVKGIIKPMKQNYRANSMYWDT